jgi:hypothetical protein
MQPEIHLASFRAKPRRTPGETRVGSKSGITFYLTQGIYFEVITHKKTWEERNGAISK